MSTAQRVYTNTYQTLYIIISVLLCGEKKIQPSYAFTCCTPWNITTEYVSWCEMASRWTLIILGLDKFLCSFLDVPLLPYGSNGSWISKVHLVEASHNANTNDPIYHYICSLNPTVCEKWLQLSVGNVILHSCTCRAILCIICPLLPQSVLVKRQASWPTCFGEYKYLRNVTDC